MKRIALLLSLMLLFSFGLAYGQSMDLGDVLTEGTGFWDDLGTTKVNTDRLISMPIYCNVGSGGGSLLGGTNGFAMYIATAAGGQANIDLTAAFDPMWWDSTYVGWNYIYQDPPGIWIPSCPSYYSTTGAVFTLLQFSIDGTGSDTLGFGCAAGEYTNGFPDGWNEILVNIHTEVALAEAGGYLCLDSAYYPPAGTWLWDPQGVPAWGGPHCFLIEKQPDPPPAFAEAGPVGPFGGNHCAAIVSTAQVATDEDATGGAGDITFSVTANSGGGTAVVAPTVQSPSGTAATVTYTPVAGDIGTTVNVTVTVTDLAAQTDELVFQFNVTNAAPTFTAGCDLLVDVAMGQMGSILFDGVMVDCDPFGFTVVSVTPDPVGTFGFNGNILEFNTVSGGYVDGVTGGDGGQIFEFTVKISDGYPGGDNTCTTEFSVLEQQPFEIVIEKLEGPDPYLGVIQGMHHDVEVSLTKGTEQLRGFDLLMAYDATALGSPVPTMGSVLATYGWEYFTWRHGANGNCGNACPNGLIQVVAIAETNNGPYHPDLVNFDLVAKPYVLFTLDFLVTNDRTDQLLLDCLPGQLGGLHDFADRPAGPPGCQPLRVELRVSV